MVLLTGHTGFKGAWLALWLRRLGADVLGLSLPGDPASPRLWDDLAHLGVTEVGADLAEPGWEHHVTAFAPTVVLHLGAQALVTVGYREPLRTFASNVMGTARVLDIVSSLSSVQVAVMVTTDKVYDPRQAPPHREADFLGGHDPYAASKAAAELVVSSWPRTSAQVVTARAGNVIGGGDWSPDRLVPDLVRAWVAGEPAALRMPGAVRPWQHVLQPLHGYLVYAERLAAAPDLPRALNFGPDDSQAVTVGAFVEHAAATWRRGGGTLPEPVTTTVPMPDVVETGHLEIDSALATDALGWRNVIGLADCRRVDLRLVPPWPDHVCVRPDARAAGRLREESAEPWLRQSQREAPMSAGPAVRTVWSRSSTWVTSRSPTSMGLTIEEVLPAYPLHLRICPECGLGQVGEFVLPERIFGDNYPYLSSTSTSWVEHARRYATDLTESSAWGRATWSSRWRATTATCFREFQAARRAGAGDRAGQERRPHRTGPPVFRPSRSSSARDRGAGIVAEHGHPRLVVANNVMAHVPDLHDFVAGLRPSRGRRHRDHCGEPVVSCRCCGDAVRHDLPRALLVPHGPRGAGASCASTASTCCASTECRRTAGPTATGSAAPGEPDVSVARTLEDELRGGLFDRGTVEVVRDPQPGRHRRPARLARRAAGAAAASLDTARRPRATRSSTPSAPPPARSSMSSTAARRSRASSCRAARCRCSRQQLSGERPVDEVVILPWNLAVELGDLVHRLAPDAQSWVAIPRMRRLP